MSILYTIIGTIIGCIISFILLTILLCLLPEQKDINTEYTSIKADKNCTDR